MANKEKHKRRGQLKQDCDNALQGISEVRTELQLLKPRDYHGTQALCRKWLKAVRGLAASLVDQNAHGASMRADLRSEESAHAQSFRDRYNHILENVKREIREACARLEGLVQPPADQQHSWDDFQHAVENDLKKVVPHGADQAVASLVPLLRLLNFNEALRDVLIQGALYSHVVLDWDLRMHREVADVGLAQVFDVVLSTFSKDGVVLSKLPLHRMPQIERDEAAHASAQQLKLTTFAAEAPRPKDRAEPTPKLPSLFLEALRGVTRLHKCKDQLEFGRRVLLEGQDQSQAQELREEILRWRRKKAELDEELKRDADNTMQEEMEEMEKDLDRIRAQIAHYVRLQGALETELTKLHHERSEVKADHQETAERHAKLEALGSHIEVVDDLQLRSRQAMDQLVEDARVFSHAFKEQVQSLLEAEAEVLSLEEEVGRLQQELHEETGKTAEMQQVLEAKEAIILRNITARRSVHDSLEQVVGSQGMEDIQGHALFKTLQELKDVVQRKDHEVRAFAAELANAELRREELIKEQDWLGRLFRQKTGKPPSRLLEGFTDQLEPDE